MKKIYKFTLVASISLSLIACNKDGDIFIDNPDKNDPSESSLGYSVIEYIPAPGQYINEINSGFENTITTGDACAVAEKKLSNGYYVSLGSWGGYIVVRFEKSIENSGNYDFSIGSNTFDTSNEPGIVWVMEDSNRNGLPDETWYELKGSHFGEEGYERNYWVKYMRPEPKGDVLWEDSNGETGFVYWLGNYHSQDYYYPNWIKEPSYTLYGSRLPEQSIQDPQTGLWTNEPFAWGYVDNYGSDFNSATHCNYFRISDAINENNEPINLSSIDFVKVQTAINNSAGWLGENSTEVTGFYSL